jgi:Sigma-70 region 2
MIRRSVVRIWRKKTTYLEESDFKMIPNEEALNREGSSFPGGTDITSIVDTLYSSLYQFAVGLTKNESDAADLVQQTFLTFSQRLDQIRDFSKIKHWLFTTLRRHFLLRIRRHKMHREVQLLSDIHHTLRRLKRFRLKHQKFFRID